MPQRQSHSKKPKRHRGGRQKPCLTVPKILEWVDSFYSVSGHWPKLTSGQIPLRDETWSGIDQALRHGLRGLSAGSSLAKLLSVHRGLRNKGNLPTLKEREIVAWAKVHFRKTGQWPSKRSGKVAGAPGENWKAIDSSLREGIRGLTGGSSLASLLAAHQLKRHPYCKPALTVSKILQWAKSFHERQGQWPIGRSGPVRESPDDSWFVIDVALRDGKRGLPGGSSLARLLLKNLGARNRHHLPPLTVENIIRWARAYLRRNGKRPTPNSGSIDNASGETWNSVQKALVRGRRGLPGGSSLAQLLANHGLDRHFWKRRPMSVREILDWADDHHARHGIWPKKDSGPIGKCAQETWALVDTALRRGYRSLPGRSSLALLLQAHRGTLNKASRRKPLYDR